MLHYKWPDDLIELAKQIATLDRGRPRQVALRRSISTAYYALFQALGAIIAVDLIVGDEEVKARLWRSVDHGAAKRLLTNTPNVKASDPRLLRIGAVFKTLQEFRHTADYDPKPFHLGRREVLALIDDVQEAISLLRSLSVDQKRSIASHLLARTR